MLAGVKYINILAVFAYSTSTIRIIHKVSKTDGTQVGVLFINIFDYHSLDFFFYTFVILRNGFYGARVVCVDTP